MRIRHTESSSTVSSSKANTGSISANKDSLDPKKSSKTYPSWHNVVAGAAAGAGARFFTAPLDLIKIRRQLAKPTEGFLTSFSPLAMFQSMRDVVRNEGGITSLFRGNLAATVSLIQKKIE